MKIGDKLVYFTDIHFGVRSNERRHNQECERFIHWMTEQAHEFGARTSIFSGDWHHYRNQIQISTLNYSVSAFEHLSRNFDKHYQIIGNHDLLYRDKRELNSVEFARELKGIEIVNDIKRVGDITLCPWLVGNEHKRMKKITTPYVFGHFEFPSFLMNAQVSMPDVGKIAADDFGQMGQHIFSGHFHKRQSKRNNHGATITYPGNCFPHSYSDAWDDERGIMLLELGKEPIFKSWPDAPKFRTLTLSQLIEAPEKYLDDKTNAKVAIDLDITFEDAQVLREGFMSQFNPREFKLIPQREDHAQEVLSEGVSFESVDQIVIEQLKAADTNYDKDLLIQIYQDI